MSTTRSTEVDPLLAVPRRSIRFPVLRAAAQFIRRAGTRRGMREPSLMVRDAAAEQLADQQTAWAHSRPVVLLDALWNLAFVAVAVAVLAISTEEQPVLPLRLWIIGYAIQCFGHTVCVCLEYWSHRIAVVVAGEDRGSVGSGLLVDLESGRSGLNVGSYGGERTSEEDTSIAKQLESANTTFAIIWWIIGFYWVSTGGSELNQDSPKLYWLCVVFLAFDVFFVVFCVAIAIIIGLAVCCCLPCIIAVLYAVADQEGASEEDINQLPKYKFHRVGDPQKLDGESSPSAGIMTEFGTDAPLEHELSAEDAECCICLSAYEDGVELRQLPCNHNFHCICVDKWLHINSTCPLCKYDIVKSSYVESGEEV